MSATKEFHMTLKDVRASALSLPLRSRARLASDLLQSLDQEFVPTERTEKEWSAEIKRRIADLDSGKDPGIPWATVRDQVKKELDARRTNGRRGKRVSSGG